MSSDLAAKTVASSRLEMSQVIEPNDANFLGKAFGGALLSMIDLCAYATASRFAGNVCVTASFDRVDFLQPIEVGELVSLVGHVSYVGRTSLEVTIEVKAENLLDGTARHTNVARVTMVAMKDGKPVEVPRLICETRDERIRFLEGKLRRELRQSERMEMVRRIEELQEMNEEMLDNAISGKT